MHTSTWVNDENVALFTDFYQLTMAQAYYREALHKPAVFDLFVRKLDERNYLLACGLNDVLEYLERFHFSETALEYLSTLNQFDAAFIDWLADFRFTGDIYAVPEGTPVFANEPILEVVAPIPEAQLVETFLLNQVTFQTGIASKAARVVHAAGGRNVVDFGMRRMHGTDSAIKAVRAYYVAGIVSTSNVLGAMMYGVKPSGTMAHSYVEIHDIEEDSFRAFASLYPETTLLVDTYDTLDGVRKVVELARRLKGEFRVGAVRLDSGDLLALSKKAREILDEGGLSDVKIFASGSLDEYSIQDLLSKGAPIDGFGVGTRMGTMADKPYLDSAYKLSEYNGAGRMKLSASKTNLPGRKQVFRFFKKDKAERDVIAVHDEKLSGTPLLELVMKGGERTDAAVTSLDEIRKYTADCLRYLPEDLHSLHQVDPAYPVEVSEQLQQKQKELRRILQPEYES